jgi:hypothetical protein
MAKRYVPDVEGDGYDFGDASPCMTEEADGDYVKASDYDALAGEPATEPAKTADQPSVPQAAKGKSFDQFRAECQEYARRTDPTDGAT